MSRDGRDLLLERFDLHLSELQGVIVAFPVSPVHTVSVRGVIASQVETVQVGEMTAFVPPGTFVLLCTRVCYQVVVPVSSAELLSEMEFCQ